MPTELTPLLRYCLVTTAARPSDELCGVFSRETVLRHIESAYEQIGDRRTVGPNFLPVIIGRFAREQLWAVARADGVIERALPDVLFVCEHNAGRSPMAASLARHLSGGRVAVHCAGSRPDEQIQPMVIEVMAEIGLDIGSEFPKPLTDTVIRAADVVVTLGCGDVCPVYAGKRYLDWPVADPAGRPLEAIRRIRYELYHHVWELVETLVPGLDPFDVRPPKGGKT